MNQAALLQRLREGDRSVFPEIVESTGSLVYNTALGIVQQEQDAEDITQEVFVTLYEKFSSFREEAKLSTWLYRITINKALDFEKKKKRKKNGGLLKKMFLGEEDDLPDFDHPGVQLDKKENAKLLFHAIKKLPEQQRIAFTLQKLEGLGNQEIAVIMESTVNAVESLQNRARINLQALLKTYYEKHFK